jgi:hypothetical protein
VATNPELQQQEQARTEQAQARAERLAAQLRAMGIDPENSGKKDEMISAC